MPIRQPGRRPPPLLDCAAPVDDTTFAAAMRLLPKSALSRAVGALARWEAPAPLRRALIRAFAARYRVDLSECQDPSAFRTFAEFFARPLKPGLRPVAPGEDVPVSPVDGVVSQSGLAEGGRLVQAKGIDYRLGDLLADEEAGRRLEGGPYATLYLSPRDYHRIHFPLGGRVVGWRYVPGELWPVSPPAVRAVPGLFCANERLVTLVESPLGLCAVAAVGATVVGRVRAAYDPKVPLTNRGGGPRRRDYGEALRVEKGQELGAFEMGSTVIAVFEKGRVRLLARVAPGERVRVGEAIGARA